MKVVLLGATKGIGRATARELAAGGHELFLLGRDVEDLDRSARDLEVRAGMDRGTVGTAFCDLDEVASFGAALDAASEHLGHFDAFLLTAARFATQEQLEADRDLTRRLLRSNFTHSVVLCEAVKERLSAQGGGTLCVVSSVAGDRGRKPVVLYGASKAGLSAYLEGLDHKHHRDGLRVIDIKPGFVTTSMTAGLKPPPFAGEPEQVARDIAKALERPRPVVYTPWIWRWVMTVIRFLPRFVMRRIGF